MFLSKYEYYKLLPIHSLLTKNIAITSDHCSLNSGITFTDIKTNETIIYSISKEPLFFIFFLEYRLCNLNDLIHYHRNVKSSRHFYK